MQVVVTDAFEAARLKYPETASWIERWFVLTTAATWTNLMEVRQTFPSADGVKVTSGRVVVIFNVGGTGFRLLTTIIYEAQIVTAIDLMPHATYDKEKWKRKL